MRRIFGVGKFDYFMDRINQTKGCVHLILAELEIGLAV